MASTFTPYARQDDEAFVLKLQQDLRECDALHANPQGQGMQEGLPQQPYKKTVPFSTRINGGPS